MQAHVFTGTKQEIADSLARINGQVREAIVFVEDPTPLTPGKQTRDEDDIFAEMLPFMVDANGMDDSRAAIYARVEGE